MRNTFNLAAVLLLGGCRFVLSQNGYNGVTIDLDGTLNCPPDANRRSYCAGDSNSTEFIVHCDNGNARLGACSLDLVGVQPVGVKLGATCKYQYWHPSDSLHGLSKFPIWSCGNNDRSRRFK
ncbi:hypothetical protein TWF225_001360 [Orbilia oligospora]|uniref:Uncharacterized protein n=1 Tax=Orbilia oligospora TaxID=2813651 RepID=A0A7C8K9J4_ORBOL|nr:hypothetical protein TWF751_008898 [Orbilia oligospora]KAF3191202.1 hypothetical protein TWF225_001360 [Orbilia oligospora]KAF3238728.1 hypothetical protein TWF128_011976 [Orbilia oligospora]KAF3238729.1 hypothetical protein TWF128_011976 [Orbilia oligospora]KAF3249642.1 hypothetical protein TWF217_008841 [Orbilia oligospora]